MHPFCKSGLSESFGVRPTCTSHAERHGVGSLLSSVATGIVIAACAASLLSGCGPGQYQLPPGGPLLVTGNTISLRVTPSTIQQLFTPPAQTKPASPSYPQPPTQSAPVQVGQQSSGVIPVLHDDPNEMAQFQREFLCHTSANGDETCN